jgi:hypothetical protein
MHHVFLLKINALTRALWRSVLPTSTMPTPGRKLNT